MQQTLHLGESQHSHQQMSDSQTSSDAVNLMQTHPISNGQIGHPYYMHSIDNNSINDNDSVTFNHLNDLKFLNTTLSPQTLHIHPFCQTPSPYQYPNSYPGYESPLNQYPFDNHEHHQDEEELHNNPFTLSEAIPQSYYDSFHHYSSNYLPKQTPSTDSSEIVNSSATPPNTIYNIVDIINNNNNPPLFVNNNNNILLPLPPLPPLVPPMSTNGFQLYIPPLVPVNTPNDATVLSVYNLEKQTTDNTYEPSNECSTKSNITIKKNKNKGIKKEIKMEEKRVKEKKETVETEKKIIKAKPKAIKPKPPKKTRKKRANKKKVTTKEVSDDVKQAQERRRIKNPKTRRKHTAIACVRCWKAKTRCSVKRPCDRCIRIGYEDCVDRPSESRRRQNVSRKKNTKTKPKKVQTQKHRDCKDNECYQAPSLESPQTSLNKLLPQLKPKKLWSVATTSLSEIMSSFNKEKEMGNGHTKKGLLSSRSLPINYRYTHTLPPNMVKLVERPILKDLGPDTTFTYLPIITRYQICTKAYCESCFGLLLNQEKNMLHLRNPHNIACPNRECHREFVQKSHLDVHLKICAESLKLIQDIKGTKLQQFEDIIKFVIKAPITNYLEMVKDVYPPQKWIDQQMQWKQQYRKKKGKKTKDETKHNLEHSPKRKLPELMRCDSLNYTNNNNGASEKEAEVFLPPVKRRKMSKSLLID